MARSREFSSNTRSIAVHLQRLDGVPVVRHAYRAARWATAGSDSPAHVWTEWHELQSVGYQGGVGVWPYTVTEGDGEAGKMPRSHKKAVVIGVGDAALQAINRETADIPGCYAYEAVAIAHGAGRAAEGRISRPVDTYMAALPLGHGLGWVNVGDAQTPRNLKAVGVRELPEDFSVAVGLLYPSRYDEPYLGIASGAEIIAQHVPTNEFAERYPGVPLL